MNAHRIALVMMAGAMLAGCKKTAAHDKQHASTNDGPVSTSPITPTRPIPLPSAQSPAKVPDASAAIEIEIASVGDLMQFDKTKLTVPTGATVHLVLKNHGKLPVMWHNWVLVRPGTEERVGTAGLMKAADAGYVVPGDDVLAYTPMAPPGKTVEVTFTAPAPGTYAYICTYPGHWVVMKGVLTVTP
jgi:azurin